MSRSSFIYSEAAYSNALDSSIGAERRGAHVPREAPGEDHPEDEDYQLQRALDVLRAGGDLARLAAAPDTVVVTLPEPEETIRVAEGENDRLPRPGSEDARSTLGPEIIEESEDADEE